MCESVTKEFTEHRGTMNRLVEDAIVKSETQCMYMKIDTEKLFLQLRDIEHFNQEQLRFRKEANGKIADSIVKANELAQQCEEFLRQGNCDLRQETEHKMIRFAENLLSEFERRNKRLEDKILFRVGFYDRMPQDDGRHPDQKSVTKVPKRPQTAQPPNFAQAAKKTTDKAIGTRLRDACQKSAVCDASSSSSSAAAAAVDMKWEVARLREYINSTTNEKQHLPQSKNNRKADFMCEEREKL